MKSIFVSISSYRDAELIPTVLNLISTADRPDQLKISIAWQHDDCENLLLIKDKISHVLDIPYINSKGVCWARSLIQELYDGEDYVLQLDSHHRFVSGWDTKLQNGLSKLQVKNKRSLISTYLPNYTDKILYEHEIFKIAATSYTKDGLLFLTPTPMASTRRDYIKSNFLSGHFIFGPGKFYDEIKYDSKLYFFGEEVSLSARAYTYGYDIYTPSKPIAYHRYDRKYRPLHWLDHTENTGTSWKELDKSSIQRYKQMFDNPIKPYFGSMRHLSSFIELVGKPYKINEILN
jgi:hypothetical protein